MAKKPLVGKQRYKTNNFEYYNAEIVTESDLFMAAFLKECRRVSGLSQRALAEKLHVNHTMIHNIENAKGRAVKYLRYMPKWRKFVNACGCVVSFSFYAIKDEDNEGKKSKRGRKKKSDVIEPVVN